MNEKTLQTKMNNNDLGNQNLMNLKWLLVLIVLALGAYLLFFNKPKQTTVTSNPGTKLTAEQEKDEFLEAGKFEAVVDITKDGFNPSTLKVKPDTKVFWKNKDSKVHKIVVTPGSKTTKYFGSEDIASGVTYKDRFLEKGDYHYYDAENPTANGVIVVAN